MRVKSVWTDKLDCLYLPFTKNAVDLFFDVVLIKNRNSFIIELNPVTQVWCNFLEIAGNLKIKSTGDKWLMFQKKRSSTLVNNFSSNFNNFYLLNEN